MWAWLINWVHNRDAKYEASLALIQASTGKPAYKGAEADFSSEIRSAHLINDRGDIRLYMDDGCEYWVTLTFMRQGNVPKKAAGGA